MIFFFGLQKGQATVQSITCERPVELGLVLWVQQ